MRYPPDFTFAAEKAAVAQGAAKCIAHLAPARRAVVQAGGCTGLWPLALAQYFERVYTFEPAPENFACLQANVAGASNIAAFPYALGATHASMGLTRPKAQAGLWRVEGEGGIPVVPLDAVLGDEAIDALVLDVEGAEVAAWQGAARLIATHRPLLWFEYLNNLAGIDDFLSAHGYGPTWHGLGGDRYSQPVH